MLVIEAANIYKTALANADERLPQQAFSRQGRLCLPRNGVDEAAAKVQPPVEFKQLQCQDILALLRAAFPSVQTFIHGQRPLKPYMLRFAESTAECQPLSQGRFLSSSFWVSFSKSCRVNVQVLFNPCPKVACSFAQLPR